MNMNAVFNFFGFKGNRVNATSDTTDTTETPVVPAVPAVADAAPVKAKRGRKPGNAAPKAPKVPKVKPYQKLIQVMRSGEPVSPDQFKEHFKDDAKMSKNMYRLSAYMWEIRQNGGIIKVAKDGKNVVSYQLVNADDFNESGSLLVPVQILTPVAMEAETEKQETVAV